MGFLSTVGDIAGNIAQDMIKEANEIKEIKEKFDNYSNSKLTDIYKDNSFIGGSSDIEKRIAKKILQDRGYSV